MSSSSALPPFDPTGAPPNEAALVAYFEGRLPAKEAHRVAQWLATETPEAEAIEGLQLLPPAEIHKLSGRVNAAVQRASKRNGRKKQPLSQGWSMAFAIAVLVILVVAAFLVIMYLKKPVAGKIDGLSPIANMQRPFGSSASTYCRSGFG